jgi:hypothetical protein
MEADTLDIVCELKIEGVDEAGEAGDWIVPALLPA